MTVGPEDFEEEVARFLESGQGRARAVKCTVCRVWIGKVAADQVHVRKNPGMRVRAVGHSESGRRNDKRGR